MERTDDPSLMCGGSFPQPALTCFYVDYIIATMDAYTLHIILQSDKSLDYNTDGASPLNFVVWLGGSRGRVSMFHFWCNKVQRVFRSVLGAYMVAFDNSVDLAILVKHNCW